jgi:hypothetical protein
MQFSQPEELRLNEGPRALQIACPCVLTTSTAGERPPWAMKLFFLQAALLHIDHP